MSGIYHSKSKRFTPNQLPLLDVDLFKSNNEGKGKALMNHTVLFSENFRLLKINRKMALRGAISAGSGSTGTDTPEDECPPGTICLDDVTITAPTPTPDPPTIPDVDIPDLPPPGPVDTFPTEPTIPSGGGGETSGNNHDIIDSLQGYPCAQSLLAALPDLKNTIADSIRSVFRGDCTYHMKFVAQDTLKGKGTDGTAKTKLVPTNGVNFNDGYTFQSKIDLNPDVLDNATKEYILVTMYHEAVHAYMAAELDRLGAMDFKEKYPDVNHAYLEGPNGRIDITKAVFVADHSVMAKAFLDDLKKTILSFNPAFPEERAKALAKGGIVNLSQAEKDINAEGRDTRTNKYHGKKC